MLASVAALRAGGKPSTAKSEAAQWEQQWPEKAAKEGEGVSAQKFFAKLPHELDAQPATDAPASWSKPLKVFISKYECEVPELDPDMPAKKRFPEWSP